MTPSDQSYREIHLTKGYIAIVDAADYERCSETKWQAWVDRRKDGTIKNVYAQRTVRVAGKKKHEVLHRFILGVSDPLVKVDHWDRDGLNCRRYNLREATISQNGGNSIKPRNNASGFKGVSWHAAPAQWRSDIRVNGKTKFLGYSSSPIAAAHKYDTAAIEAFGEFANLNFPR